jgi:hypothetical protein
VTYRPQTKKTQFSNLTKTYLKNDFFKAIKDYLHRIEALTLIVPDTPQVSNNHLIFTNQVNTIQNNQIDHIQNSDEEAFQEESLEINKLIWRNPKSPVAPDISIQNEPAIINQHKFNSSSLYKWNIDGMSEYHILNTL